MESKSPDGTRYDCYGCDNKSTRVRRLKRSLSSLFIQSAHVSVWVSVSTVKFWYDVIFTSVRSLHEATLYSVNLFVGKLCDISLVHKRDDGQF